MDTVVQPKIKNSVIINSSSCSSNKLYDAFFVSTVKVGSKTTLDPSDFNCKDKKSLRHSFKYLLSFSAEESHRVRKKHMRVSK